MGWQLVMERPISFFSVESLIIDKAFFDPKLSTTENYSGGYLYKDPLDSNYVHDKYLESFGPGFYTGGQQKHHDERTVKSANAKFDLNWIVNKNHSIKTGLNFTNYDVDNSWKQIRNRYFGTAEGDLYALKFLEIRPFTLISTQLNQLKCQLLSKTKWNFKKW